MNNIKSLKLYQPFHFVGHFYEITDQSQFYYPLPNYELIMNKEQRLYFCQQNRAFAGYGVDKVVDIKGFDCFTIEEGDYLFWQENFKSPMQPFDFLSAKRELEAVATWQGKQLQGNLMVREVEEDAHVGRQIWGHLVVSPNFDILM